VAGPGWETNQATKNATRGGESGRKKMGVMKARKKGDEKYCRNREKKYDPGGQGGGEEGDARIEDP